MSRCERVRPWPRSLVSKICRAWLVNKLKEVMKLFPSVSPILFCSFVFVVPLNDELTSGSAPTNSDSIILLIIVVFPNLFGKTVWLPQNLLSPWKISSNIASISSLCKWGSLGSGIHGCFHFSLFCKSQK